MGDLPNESYVPSDGVFRPIVSTRLFHECREETTLQASILAVYCAQLPSDTPHGHVHYVGIDLPQCFFQFVRLGNVRVRCTTTQAWSLHTGGSCVVIRFGRLRGLRRLRGACGLRKSLIVGLFVLCACCIISWKWSLPRHQRASRYDLFLERFHVHETVLLTSIHCFRCIDADKSPCNVIASHRSFSIASPTA